MQKRRKERKQNLNMKFLEATYDEHCISTTRNCGQREQIVLYLGTEYLKTRKASIQNAT